MTEKELKRELRPEFINRIDEIIVFHKLNDENMILTRLLNILEKTVEKLIKWVCKKFAVFSEESFIRDFEKETGTYLDAEKQLQKEERQKEKDIGMEL